MNSIVSATARRQGFTLLELVIVILLLGILGAAAFPAFASAYAQFKLDAGADAVATALLTAQSVAIQRQHTIEVSFDTANEKFQVRDVDAGAVLQRPMRGGNYVIDLQVEPMLAGIMIEQVAFANSGPTVQFDSRGKASATGWVKLRYSGAAKLVRLAGVAGRVTISDS